MQDTKRSRRKNFLDNEKEMLIYRTNLIVPHKSIIENINLSTFITLQIYVTRRNILLNLVVI